ncbi:otoferlin isoform X5 [Spodoptera frugiperda]|uniref:Otoferlin isoform X1 n=1 Tax=Spodoptera frugiperda TaxID=7108 RepID=A0A9R0F5Y7_SPOFR|nr:otoferlin isoform X2 [Spodoptera frugiperda]XP_050560285.1 otoferlin isoform X1 [Spodoptera frugiperda]XP_050560286.1 otoferlin isoform X3 [Spodoptera frugiperda]XP_050560287.1 otoferlin isoform X4 [Spodoptera frugiperda]XP_050560288.1 otoferlin isoform X5 [Spodoptera frugiperda]
MALVVKLNRFKVLKCKYEKFARLDFRGSNKYSSVLLHADEIIFVNQRFEWVVVRPIDPGEVVTLHLLTRVRWGAPRVLGVYRLGLQIVVTDGQISVTDTLVDERNKPVPVFVDMDVYYNPPTGSLRGDPFFRADMSPHRPASCNIPMVHGAGPSGVVPVQGPSGYASTPGSSRGSVAGTSPKDSDDNVLDDVERNIASIEQAIRDKEVTIDMECLEESRTQKLKTAGKRFLKRGFTLGSEKVVIDMPERKSRPSTLKTVRTLMRLGKVRPSRCSSDEEQGLLETPGPSSEPDRPLSQISMSSDEMLVDVHSPSETRKFKRMRTVIDTGVPSALKAADFQVCVTVIEARQLAGLNMDPVVCVQIGDVRKYTSVKESTNCPYYNEYFVFDFHMPPIMLFDKIITLSVLQSRNILRANKLLGSFKLDVATVWSQPDRQFFHKWALLTDPDDVGAGAKGYLKCDISVIGKGDAIKVPPKSEKDEDDIEANLLLPEGVPIERQRARFIVTIHKADGLPKMNYSLLANFKRAFTGESQDLVDPFVQVCFAGMTGSTSVRKNTYTPVWNEQIVFTEMFPPLCQRIKLQLRDNVPVNPNVIGTHFIDLKTISNDGDRGFLPTFGPAYIYMYGSTRDYSLLDQHAGLNMGMGEGVSYRGRLLVSIRTEIIDGIECPLSDVEVEPIPPINEASYEKNEEFFLFGSIFEANMIDKRLTDKPLQFELSLGNSGNSLDGHNESVKRPHDLEAELDELCADTGYWQSTTQPAKAASTDKTYYYLPYWDHKQCMHIRSIWPDHRRRMYNSNLIANIIEKYEEGLADAQAAIDAEIHPDSSSVLMLKSTLESLSGACSAYVRHMTNAPPLGHTKLDKERQKLCVYEIEQIAAMAKSLRALITKHSIKERLRTAYSYLNMLKHLCEDAQHALPDIFIWLISNGKRLAYQRIPARDIIYSDFSDESGKYCGKMQTLFLKWPGKKSASPSGWSIPAKISVYLWLGILQHKKHYIDGLPQGYEVSSELRNADKLRSNAPSTIFYAEKHNFQMRAYVYQARSLIGSDSSGLSDPFARIVIGESSGTTQVIDETLSPTWDELLVFDDVLLYSTIERIKADPPTIVIEIFDQDKVGKSEFIGRTLAKPRIKSYEDVQGGSQNTPSLEWHEITRGDDRAGELLATFELLEIPPKQDSSILPNLPSPREANGKPPIDINKGPILPVPRGIRPTLSKYRIEVLFWGLRDLKRVHLLTVDRPRVDIECAGNILYSSVIQNAKRNPNFTNPIRFVDVELPEQDLYRPPLTIRVVDCRSFGRITLVGTHTINSIHKYIYTPMSKRERDIEERKKSLIPLQNVDLRANCIVPDDTFTIENEKESCPLLNREGRGAASYGSGIKPQVMRKKFTKRESMKKRKASTDSALDDDEGSKDWWTKYFASVESMIEEEKEAKRERQGFLQPSQAHGSSDMRSPRSEEINSPRSERERERDRDRNRRRQPTSPKPKVSPTLKKNEIPRSALAKIYPHELEAVPEYDEFKEWLHSFELYRGKKTGDDSEDENRVVGVFKGAIKVYKWPLPRGIDDHTVMGFDPNYGFFQGVPNNEPIHVLVRVYIVKATDLHPMDLNGKADPYIVLHLGSKRISDKENYVSKQLNPVFGKCFEIEATFPQDSLLTIQVLDWDLLGADDLIGETKIDLENRFYSRHRATCGLPMKYEEQGYNRWRDAMKPTQILAKLCKDGKLDPPVYEYGRVKIGRTVFNMHMEDTELFSNPDTVEEQMALLVLRRWQEVPRVGTRLVTEHVETRPLYNPSKPGIEQGRLQMWVDMFPMDMPLPGPPMDISARKPKSYEMRVIIWNTDDVVLEDDAFFTGEKMSDIYVKGWVKGPDDCQSTDIHYRSLTGEGNFNWRFIYPFDYLEAEERIVISRKESVFSWDETECKIPARLELQVWDADHFSADDFLGAITLDLSRFPRGAKSSKLCTLDMLQFDGSVPMVNIFKQKRVKGWWPFYIKRDTEEMELTGKVEAEIHLLTREEADKVPAGLGRNEPDPLDKPNRPDASFMWFLNPLKSIRYIVWHNYKWTILKASIVILLTLMILLLVYAVPGYTVKKLLGA